MFKATTLTIALLLCFYSYGQVEPIYSNYQHYTTEDGLPQNYVSSIVQDHDGFIWVATMDGIARFDGKDFIEFNITSEDARRISTPRVIDLKVDDQNNLWILHFNQKVDVIDPETLVATRDVQSFISSKYDNFPLAMCYKTAIYFSFAGELDNEHWFVKSADNYQLFDSTNYKLARLFSSKKGQKDSLFAFDVDDQERLWTLGQSGLTVSDSDWENVRKINFADHLDFEISPETLLSLLAQISDDRMLMFIDQRLLIYDESKDEYRELKLPLERSKKTHHVIATRDELGRVVFSYQGFIFRVNEDESISVLWEFPERDKFIISALFVDKDGILWAGINTGGLYRINTLIPSFDSKKYKENFLVDLLMNEMEVRPAEIPPNWFQGKGAYDFRYNYTSSGRLYFSMDGYYFGRKNRIFYLDKKKIKRVKSKPSIAYFRQFHEQNGNLSAIDSYGNYYLWNDINEYPKINKAMPVDRSEFFNLAGYVQADGYLWVLNTENKIYQIKGGETVESIDVGDEDFGLVQIENDPTTPFVFWIATYGGGLIKWNSRTFTVEKILTKEDGLPDNTIAAMVPDDQGNIWMSTFNGVTKFNPTSEIFSNFRSSDGLIQAEFDRYHHFKLPDGRIAFGASEGYSVFQPNLFVEDDANPHVKFSKLSINDKEQQIGDSLSIISQPLNQLQQLELNYNMSSITLEIMTDLFSNPDKIKYRYKLSGYNADWVSNESARRIKFDKLRTGNYTLSLNASNTNGRWSNEIRELNIRILPPPWLSWWAYTVYFLFGCTLVFLYWRNYRRKLIQKQEVEFNRREAVRLKEVDDMKTRFFSNITHEFRTPLTLILSPLEKQLRDKKYPMEVQTILESNYRHGSHLLKLVNELLDISKLEGGFMQSHKSTGELTIFLKGCVEDFSELAQQTGIDLTFESKNINGYHQFDKNHLEKVVLNLLSNAIKFTDQGGKVGLRAKVIEDEKLILEVHDSGIGIPKDQLPKLFDRFYQVDDSATRAYEGTGIGLSLVKELTDLMEGNIVGESTVGEGTIFKLSIPVSKAIVVSEPTSDKKMIESELPEGAPVILVVEDNGELRSFIVESLAKVADVIEAKDGKEGWQKILERLPDIVVSDVMMPEMNGYELCHKSKTDRRTSHIDFILLTAKTAQESKEKGLESGADDYLTKPFHMYELELRIQNAFQQQANLRKHLRQEFLSLRPDEKTPAVKNDFLRQLYETLSLNISDKNVNVEELALEMAMSQSTLNRKLKALLGLSAIEFIKQARLQRAVELLSTGQNMSDIAYQVGFESPSYFSQCFKETYQMSPTDYQKQLD